MMKGIDISSWQKGLDPGALDVGFVIAKLAEGGSRADPAFDAFYRAAKVPMGAYVFSYATDSASAREEARHALSLLRARPLPLGVYMDVETPEQLALPKAKLCETARAFCDQIREAGYRAGVYGSELGAWSRLEPSALGDALVWVANWSRRPQISCDLWQFSDKARFAPWGGPLDGDEAVSERMRSLIGGAETQPPAQDGPDRFTLEGVPLLRQGDSGDAVKALQGELIAFGYRCGGRSAGETEIPDGVFGPRTCEAVTAFQKERALTVDGVAGRETRGALLGAGT